MQFTFDFEYDMHKAEETACKTGEIVTVTFEGGRVSYTHEIRTNEKGRVTARRTFKIDGKRASRANAIELATEMELDAKHPKAEAEPETTEQKNAAATMMQAEVMGAVTLPNGATLMGAAEYLKNQTATGGELPKAGERNAVWIRYGDRRTIRVKGWEHLMELVCFDHPAMKASERHLLGWRQGMESMERNGMTGMKLCYWMGWHVVDSRGNSAYAHGLWDAIGQLK